MALGSYDATPMDMASAYTIFTNDGQRITPIMVRSVRDANGDVIDNFQPQKTQVLDPRVAYVITDMMQGVINNGTAAGPAESGRASLPLPPPEKPAPRMTAGLPALPQTCSASSGWVTMITVIFT